MKNNRLFGIIYLLLKTKTIAASKLASYFEVSVRTIYRDVESLSQLDIPIYMSKGKNGGISLLDNYKFDKTLLSKNEQDEILFSLEGITKLKNNNFDTYEKIKNLFSKDNESWFDIDFNTWGNSIEHKDNFNILKNAIINKNTIKFYYFNSYGISSDRYVEPLKLCFKYNSWYLYGYDKNKDDYRFFKLTRIKNLNQLEDNFIRKIENKDFNKGNNYQMIKLIFEIDKFLSFRVYDEFKESDIKKLDNGNFLIEVNYPYNEWIYGYLLSYGEYIKIVEPLFIKEKIIERLKKSIKNYL